MSNSIYLINPLADSPSYYGAEVLSKYGYPSTTLIADLAITTVAAMVPNDFTVSICDEHITPVEIDTAAEVIGITGKVSQSQRMLQLAQIFQEKGKIVLMGGPYVSLCPELFRPYCDILVQGELETIAEALFADLRNGSWQSYYLGGQPTITSSPQPRWDLYPNKHAMMGSVQTSRGCPYECEFCDVIQYVGRKQRHKTPRQVTQELDVLYHHGYRSVFLADDNLTVYRHRAKALLAALQEWNDRRTDGRVHFMTQLSIDTANDDEILRLLSSVGPFEAFIGLESPNEESLREVKKRQNIGKNMVQRVHHLFEHGISVQGGMIVGFDADGLDIFERQFEFAMDLAVPIVTLGALIAPQTTPLYERMEQEKRLITAEAIGANLTPWHTNIIMKQLPPVLFTQGMKWLGNRLYHPRLFGQRVLNFIDRFRPGVYWEQSNARVASGQLLPTHILASKVIWRLSHEDIETRQMLAAIMKQMEQKPATRQPVMASLFRYAQIRYMYQYHEFWQPELAQENSPFDSYKENAVA